MIITWPVNIKMQDWFDQVALDVEAFGAMGKIGDHDNWQDYAAHLCTLGRLNQKNVPNPYEFDDWQTWADLFVRAVN